MSINLRYRLIQFVEILLWLGAAVGLGNVARRVWSVRDQGWRAMLDLAAPGLLAVGVLMAALIVLIGIYHNSRRNADALERLARQGAGTLRRLPGAARADAAPMAVSPMAPAAQPVAIPQPAFAPQPAPAPAPQPVFMQPPAPARATVPEAAPVEHPVAERPAPVAPPAKAPETPRAPAPILRNAGRRLGPAS